MQLDESADDKALLMAYVWYFVENSILLEEVIFTTIKSYFILSNILLNNIITCTTDGELSIIVHCCSFSAYLKKC